MKRNKEQMKQFREEMQNRRAENARKENEALEAFRSLNIKAGDFIQVSYKTSANTAVVTFLEGKDKDKVGTINLNNAKLIKENK